MGVVLSDASALTKCRSEPACYGVLVEAWRIRDMALAINRGYVPHHVIRLRVGKPVALSASEKCIIPPAPSMFANFEGGETPPRFEVLQQSLLQPPLRPLFRGAADALEHFHVATQITSLLGLPQ